MNDDTYNGWSNHATWRVNLEFLGDDDYYDGNWFVDHDIEYTEDIDANEIAWMMGESMEESVTEFVELESANPNGLTVGWVRSFLSEVNWYEIASHHVAEWIVENERKS